MYARSLLLSAALLFSSTALFAQSENSVDIVPHWKQDEAHSVKIKSTTIDNNNGKTENYVSTFDAKFTVKEFSDSGYQVEWIYTDAKPADNDPTIENGLIAKLVNTKLLIRLSKTGRFVTLLNADEVKPIADKTVDELIAGNATNQAMSTQYKTAKQLISSKQGLEVAILKQIKFYNFSFGYRYKSDVVQTNNIKIGNPLGGPPFDAIEKVHLTKLDKQSSVCTIETSKTIDDKILKTFVVEYVKKASNGNPQAIDEVSKADITMTENTMQQIDFAKGIIQKGSFKRTMNLGFKNRVTVMEIETIN